MDNSPSKSQTYESILTIPFISKKQYKKNDFEFISVSGQGSYAKVFKVKDLTEKDHPLKAIKMMEISVMKQQHKLYHIYLENEVLNLLQHPNLVSIQGIFEDQRKIFIVLEYLNKGDFSDLLMLNYPLKEDTIKYYTAEIVNVLEYLKKNKVVHRDLKPENIMLDNNYHLKVIDFATARIIGKYFNENTMKFEDEANILPPAETPIVNAVKDEKDRKSQGDNLKDIRCNSEKIDIDDSSNKNKNLDEFFDDDEVDDENIIDMRNRKLAQNQYRDDDDDEGEIENRKKRGITFVGTAEYVSPEVLKDIPADYGADIWALGCMVYLMFFGHTPFKEKTEYLIFQKIKESHLTFPEKEISEDAKDLIIKLLDFDPKKRLGNGEDGTENDFAHLKNHPFFNGINFETIEEKAVPFKDTFKLKEKIYELKAHKVESKAVPKKEIERKIEIIKKGILQKKSPLLHYNTREIIVDSTPKLEYIDPSTKQIKGSVYLTKSCSAEPCDDVVFYLNTPKRKFKFKSSEKEAFVWVKTINDAIRMYS